MNLPEISRIVVVFDLPAWVTDERYDYERIFYFNQYHAWAGTYDRTDYGLNVVQDALHALGQVQATNWYPGGYATVEAEFSCGVTALTAEVMEFQRDLAEVLEKAKKLRGKTIYVNKGAIK